MKLLVRNLDRLTTEEELITIFKEFGEIEYVDDDDNGEQ